MIGGRASEYLARKAVMQTAQANARKEKDLAATRVQAHQRRRMQAKQAEDARKAKEAKLKKQETDQRFADWATGANVEATVGLDETLSKQSGGLGKLSQAAPKPPAQKRTGGGFVRKKQSSSAKSKHCLFYRLLSATHPTFSTLALTSRHSPALFLFVSKSVQIPCCFWGCGTPCSSVPATTPISSSRLLVARAHTCLPRVRRLAARNLHHRTQRAHLHLITTFEPSGKGSRRLHRWLAGGRLQYVVVAADVEGTLSRSLICPVSTLSRL